MHSIHGLILIFFSDTELEDYELDTNRYKPKGLEALCRSTKFNRQELQLMYRGFKQVCPSGVVTEENFRDIYAKFFPHGGKMSMLFLHLHLKFITFFRSFVWFFLVGKIRKEKDK